MTKNERNHRRRWIGRLGVTIASPFFIWLAIGWVPGIPSMEEVFGVAGLRWPAAVAVAGLLIAAIGYWEY